MLGDAKEKTVFMTNSFSMEVMEQLFDGCPELFLKKNADLYRPGDQVSYVYWLFEGLVEVYASSENGIKQVVAYHYPNSFVADIQALSEEDSFLTCTALKKCKLKKCHVDLFMGRLQEKGLMRNYLKLLVGKTQANVMQLAAVSLEDCETRIKRYYNDELTHQQLAELVGCTRVQVTRVMNRHSDKKK